jgi:hypothetical protein
MTVGKIKNKSQDPRTPEQITQDYTTMCAELGNALLNFETLKSNYINKFIQLNKEMQLAKHLEQTMEKEVK